MGECRWRRLWALRAMPMLAKSPSSSNSLAEGTRSRSIRRKADRKWRRWLQCHQPDRWTTREGTCSEPNPFLQLLVLCSHWLFLSFAFFLVPLAHCLFRFPFSLSQSLSFHSLIHSSLFGK